jgi:hypothetical protein
VQAGEQGEGMAKEKQGRTEPSTLAVNGAAAIDEAALFERVVAIIENRKSRAGVYVNREVTLMYWEVGKYVSSVVLDYKRGEYGKRILATLSQQLRPKYGNSFEYTKITRMIKFADLFPNPETVATIELVALQGDTAAEIRGSTYVLRK